MARRWPQQDTSSRLRTALERSTGVATESEDNRATREGGGGGALVREWRLEQAASVAEPAGDMAIRDYLPLVRVASLAVPRRPTRLEDMERDTAHRVSEQVALVR